MNRYDSPYQRTDDRQLTFLGYGVVVVSTVGIFVDTVNTLDLGSVATVLGLLGIAAVLFGLRARLDDANRLVAGRTATRLFGVLVGFAVVILLVLPAASRTNSSPSPRLRSMTMPAGTLSPLR